MKKKGLLLSVVLLPVPKLLQEHVVWMKMQRLPLFKKPRISQWLHADIPIM